MTKWSLIAITVILLLLPYLYVVAFGVEFLLVRYYYYYYISLTAFFPGQPG